MIELVGDAVSRLVQLQARQHGVHLKWTLNGPQDIAALCADLSNKTMLSQCLWNGMKELMAMPELKEIPEAVQAKICSIILQAQAVFELRVAERNKQQAQGSFKPDARGRVMLGLALAIVSWAGGVWMGILWNDYALEASRTTHNSQMDEIMDEVSRLRAQVAGLIGK